MNPQTLSDRLRLIMSELQLNQTEFGTLVGATKGAVNQWLSEHTKTIGAEYAFALQHKAGYSAEWVMFGTGPPKLITEYGADPRMASVLACMQQMDEYGKDLLVKISASMAKPNSSS